MSLVTELLEALSTFPNREADSRRIKRWHTWKPMYYRPDLYSHGKKIGWFVEAVAPVLVKTFGSQFDVKRAVALALVHDDPEIITGDYQAGDKAKMSAKQLAAIDAEERAAIVVLAERYPKTFAGFNYQELQDDVQDLRTTEARVTKFLDIFDGYGEGVHELYAGNRRFTEHIVNEFGTIPLFDTLNLSKRTKMMQKFPDLALLRDSHTIFELAAPPDWRAVLPTRSPHTLESLPEPTGYAQYDEWKKIIIGTGDSEEIKNLYTQQEFS